MRSEIARGAAWMVLLRLFDRSIGIISTTVLARLLVPADFGLVAMAMSVIAIVELATAFSFEVALIQKPNPQREHFDTAWTLNILIAIAGAAVTVALAWPTATFYGDPRLAAVMLVIGGAWLVSGFENTGTANFRREMNFSAEFRWMAAKRMVSFIVTLVAAFTLRSYWALVIGMATARLSGVALSYLVHPFRPRFALSRARELFSYSGWVLAINIATVIFGRLPQIYVGRVFGAEPLGAYTVGSEIAQLPHTELVAPINRAMFPGYARLVGDLPSFRKVCTEATAVLLMVVLPVSAAVAILAGPIVRILLGAQWWQAVPVIQILAFAGAFTALNANAIAAYLALGKPRVPTIALVIRVAVFVVAVMVSARGRGMFAVAYAELLAAAVTLSVSLPLLLSTLHIKASDYVASLWRPLVACALGAALMHVVAGGGPVASLSKALVQLLGGLAIGAVAYPSLLWVLWHLSGRPRGAETAIGRRSRDALIGLRNRLREARRAAKSRASPFS
jgi:O-antigen/teichoic acid export membrane protein